MVTIVDEDTIVYDEVWCIAMISKIIMAVKSLPKFFTQEQKLAIGWNVALSNCAVIVWPKASQIIVDHL